LPSRAEALAETDRLFRAEPSPALCALRLLGHVPDPFALFRPFPALALRFGFPPQGWDIRLVEDSDRAFAFTVHRCFYRDVCAAYGASELTALFCAKDDRAYAALPPSIVWERKDTLGRGGDRCDFRWCRAPSAEESSVGSMRVAEHMAAGEATVDVPSRS
jgi:hypothetical protein